MPPLFLTLNFSTMKKNLLSSKSLTRLLLLPVLAIVMMTVHSCKKENLSPNRTVNPQSVDKSTRMKDAVVKALSAFEKGKPAVAGGSQRDFSSGASYTTYSTPSTNVYQWSDVTSGTVFTLTESTGGNGLGQLSYSGKSFMYNYVLSIKASGNDPNWNGFFNGRDLRGVVAIDGDFADGAFTLKNLAIFFVATNGGTGTYKFIDFSANTFTMNDALGEILDLSEGDAANLANVGAAKVYITSGGHISVSESSFDMESDAKIMDLNTSVETSVDGSIMFE